MRRLIPVAILSVVVAAASAVAGASGRTVERRYVAAETHPAFPQGGVQSSSSVTFRPRPHERWVSVAIDDQSGLVVPGKIMQSGGGRDVDHAFCGATSKPVAIDPSAPVKVVRYHGSCDDDSTDPTRFGTWTNGTVTATFARASS